MKLPERVVWSEGLLLTPQHLQQQDRFHEASLAARLDALDPLSWGVLRMEFDRRALASGQLSALECQGVLQGGAYVHVRADDPELPPSRPIAEAFAATRSSLLVYLGLPRERDGVNNYSRAPGGRERYVIEHRMVGDALGTADPVEVPVGRRNLMFLLGSESREDIDAIPVAEVVRDETGAYTLLETFVPPCVRIDASPFLQAGLRRVVGAMTTRQRALADSRRERDASSVEFAAQDVSRYLLLSAINARLPVLNSLSEAGDIHPRALYFILTEFAGHLATFATNFDPLSLPKYNHLDLRATYEELFARLTFLLQSSFREHFVAWPLEARASDGMHFAQLGDDRILTCGQFFLAVKTKVPEQQSATTLPKLSKVASWNDLQGILAASTPGAPVEVTFRPPVEIPVKAGVLYFAVSTENPYWRNIMVERKIAVFLPQPFDGATTQIQLLGIPGAVPGRSPV